MAEARFGDNRRSPKASIDRSRPPDGWSATMLSVALFLTLAALCISVAICEDSPVVKELMVDKRNPTSEVVLNHMTVDDTNGVVFLGAVNRLYQLSMDLEKIAEVKTGPQLDSPKCSVTQDCPVGIAPEPTDNVNKLLLIDRSRRRLIVCGSLFQGRCEVRDILNISDENAHKVIREGVVASNATASTVGFIAPGPSDSSVNLKPQVLYVGVTFIGGNFPYRSDIPAVASRSLEDGNMFQLARQDVTTGTRMFVNALSREQYPIHYVHGFSSDRFSYFLTVQMVSTEASPFISKLVRVCQDDKDYYSYTEVPIDCISPRPNGTGGIKYNLVQAAYVGKPGSDLAKHLDINPQDDVLFAVFAQSDPTEGDTSSKPAQNSALCIYALKYIRRKFLDNIKKCFKGEAQRGLAFISPSNNCTTTKLSSIDEDFCGMDVNTPLGGKDAVAAAAVYVWPNTLVTSVAATATSDYTVVFLGTDEGHLKKVVVDKTGNEYADLPISLDDGPVNADLRFDHNKPPQHVYVMTRKMVKKVKVQECHVYKTCNECLGARDPYCGWCSLENKCSLKSDCRQASKYWISYKEGRCTTIVSVTPDKLQSTTAVILHLEIDNLPELTREYVCAFTAMGKTITTNATRVDKIIKCPTPRNDLLPVLTHGQHYFTSLLSLRFSDGQDFVATNFTFFNCNSYGSCTSCVSSSFECDWCVDGNRCTHDAAENCRNDVLVTGVERQGPSIRSGPDFCPRIHHESEEILVASGTSMGIRVKVDNIAQFIVQARFVCQFNIDGRVVMKSGQLLGDTIYCDKTRFSYNSLSPNLTASFAVIWGNSKSLDNPKNIRIVIYRCDVMADNCGMCLSLDPKYKCGWCQSANRCTIEKHCEEGGAGVWLKEADVCPDPMIVDFSPKYGPWEGGTNITITGVNLGRTVDDIYKNIMVAGIPCLPYRETYIQTRQVTCTPDSPGVADPRKGIVIVRVGSFRAGSKDTFEFVNPVLYSVRPRRGPQSGGTELTIRGRYMNAGSRITAYVNDLPCNITRTSMDEARCVTSAAPYPINGVLRVNFDKGERKLENETFEYIMDPVVFTVEPGLGGGGGQTRSPKGIVAGGIKIRVTGDRFNVVQHPQMYVADEAGTKFFGQCEIESADTMLCRSPLIETDEPLTKAKNLEYGFIMDNVPGVRNLSGRFNSSFVLYPNPIFEKFEESIKYYKSDYLTINGRELDRACTEADVVVMIGTERCNVTSLSRNQLTCRPPDQQPPGVDVYGTPTESNLPQVIVIVGGNLTYNIGNLSYSPPGLIEAQLPQEAIFTIIAAAGVLLLVIIIIIFMYRRKSTENARVLKNMQDQMDVLELKVAAECKEAFAELQTEITDLTSDLTTGGIPFLDYRTYAMKILFPNIEDHPVLRLDIPDFHRKEKGLRLFGTLIMNKTFLLLFIRTLESNRYFSMRDRVNVASLIMVALQGKMEYSTDVLKTLLAELIEKCMDGRSHPKLLLRRTESVAEKMLSAWFTFLLYKFLRECAGEPLFLLYRAMKQQVDKGPVDSVTSEARYSLSEEKLIRQQIDYKLMSVFISMSTQTACVSGYDAIHDTNDVYVKVLNCDTISQVKEKALDAIYKNTPYTQRPSKDDLDLEWRIGPTSRITLSDEDSKMKVENGWKRYNTLSSYGVPDQAYLTLLPRLSSVYNFAAVPGMGGFSDTLKSHKYETLNLSKFSGGASPPMSRATSPLNSHDYGGMDSSDRGGPGSGSSNCRYWHLVRHSDQDHHQNGKDGERSNKMVSEIYLTRLLATKITLQKFVDDLFETIFSIAHRGSALPLAIKYMFDFLDDQAIQHGIQDNEVVHTWKSNSLPLRFWVNLIKNPNFVFDIHKGNVVDSCLSVVAQTFMDSCSTSDHRLGKDSPSSKLLYAKDIPVYKDWVERYYHDIKTMPAISDQDMNAMLAEESRMHGVEFNTNASLHELYTYALKYNDQLRFTLEDDEFSKKQRLAHRLQQVHELMAGDQDA